MLKEPGRREHPLRLALSAGDASARWRALLDQAQHSLSGVVQEMEEYDEERSVAWQESERGQSFEEPWQVVQELLESLEQLVESAASP